MDEDLVIGAADATSHGVIASTDFVRARRFMVLLAGLNAMVAGGTLLLGTEKLEARLSLLGNAIAIVASLAWLKVVKREDRFNLLWMALLGQPHFLAGSFVLYYCGYYSPSVAVWVITVYVFATARSRAIALFVYLNAAIITGAAMLLIAFGVLEDRGQLAVHAERPVLLSVFVATEVVLGAVFHYARQSARTLRGAVEALEQAKREILRREALLEEANADLDRVLHARAGPATGSLMRTWRLGALLGRGGMGEVYSALNEENGTMGAVKILVADPGSDPNLAERFRREARALARVEHPNVVRLLDVGEGWIAMELLEGIDLAKLLRKRHVLQSKEVTKLVSDVAAALEAARQATIVHRDLKPQNIFFVEETQRWKVLDFGLSKLEERDTTLTQEMPLGTPAYMAPEQVEGGPLDHRADVFALGLVAYRAITGRPAFSAEEPAAVLFDVLFEQPPRPSELAPVDIDVDFALALALAKSPKDRLDRAIDLAAALDAAFRGALSPSLRNRAQTLLAVHGWGERRLASVRNLPRTTLYDRSSPDVSS